MRAAAINFEGGYHTGISFAEIHVQLLGVQLLFTGLTLTVGHQTISVKIAQCRTIHIVGLTSCLLKLWIVLLRSMLV